MSVIPHINHYLNNFEDFFENTLCGFVTTNIKGQILRANAPLAHWIGTNKEDLIGVRFSDLLTIGGKIYYETHLSPLLKMQGFFDEVALELSTKNGNRIQVLVNAYERKDDAGKPLFIRLTIIKATDRLIYEQNLRASKAVAEEKLKMEMETALLREQFIAVLGHDLRNPLSAVLAGSSVLERSSLGPRESKLVAMIQKSAKRMAELIENVMDFARARLGGGMILNRRQTSLAPILMQVVDELRSVWPTRTIETTFRIDHPVDCDSDRISQLLSNLLANAITHGAVDGPVYVDATLKEECFELSVINTGKPISPNIIEHLFQPFTREIDRPSQHGLGLGLYIASQIAKAHKGELKAISNETATTFTFSMPLQESM